MGDPFVWIRAVHFAATILVSGVIFFLGFIAEPAFCEAGGIGEVPAVVRLRLVWLGWAGIITAAISGAAWLFFVAARMEDLPLTDTLSREAIWPVLRQTDFGHDWIVRLALVAILAIYLLSKRLTELHWKDHIGVFLAAGLVGTLAWAGHGTADSGLAGALHLGADILHLIAAAAWVGALVPLALLLGAVTGSASPQSLAIGQEAVRRFSTLGIASVSTLVLTGIVNAWLLVDGIPALIRTDYGRLLLAKIALFLLMLLLAAVNRQRLTPDLMRDHDSHGALKRIQRNTMMEAAGGAGIILIIALLGIMSPMD